MSFNTNFYSFMYRTKTIEELRIINSRNDRQFKICTSQLNLNGKATFIFKKVIELEIQLS